MGPSPRTASSIPHHHLPCVFTPPHHTLHYNHSPLRLPRPGRSALRTQQPICPGRHDRDVSPPIRHPAVKGDSPPARAPLKSFKRPGPTCPVLITSITVRKKGVVAKSQNTTVRKEGVQGPWAI